MIKDIIRLFVCRSDVYARQKADGAYTSIKKPLTEQIIQLHIEGKVTLGVYTIATDNTCKWGCWDIDIASKKEIAKMGREEIAQKKKAALSKLTILRDKLKDKFNITSYIENSGWKGYHLWIFCEPVAASTLRRFMQHAAEEAGIENVEIFPKQDSKGEFGNLVKLPLGMHQVSKARSCLLDPETFSNLPIDEALKMFPDIQPCKIPSEDDRKEIPTDKAKKTFEEVYPLLRPCVKKAYSDRWDLGDDAGHKFRVAALRELDETGASNEAMHTYYKVQPDYSYEKTEKNIRKTLKKTVNPWKCKTIQDRCKGLSRLQETCKGCTYNHEQETTREKKRKVDITSLLLTQAIQLPDWNTNSRVAVTLELDKSIISTCKSSHLHDRRKSVYA